jgi:hypothetical protein
LTVPDPLHSDEEDRFVLQVILFCSDNWLSFIPIAMIESELLAPGWRRQENEGNMSKKTKKEDEMLDEYDFTGGIRGKYVDRAAGRTNVVVLEPDVAEVFTSSESVNLALRGLLPVISRQAEKVQQR